ncbi:MAG TPA: hypothetical protein VKB38_23130 [Terracidiphilus sp.]|nr:hypothetical protein [Terracidiphilus sp.]
MFSAGLRTVSPLPSSERAIPKCPEYDRLTACVQVILGHLVHLTTRHLEVFQSGDYGACRRLDKQLERVMSEQERSLGALRKHLKEHHCQGRKISG